jgi:N-acetylneuraminate synthase
MNIAGREIGYRHPPYIIAEISCNHGGSLDRALELIELAKLCGAEAVKFQAVTPETITLNCDRDEFFIWEGPWKGRNLFELYSLTQTPFDWFPKIKEKAEEVGITWFASVFDETSVDLMRELSAPAVKIASFEITDTPLIAYAAGLGVPVILSTGMASGAEINEAARALEPHRFNQHAMLHCVSAYPTPFNEANLLRLKFGVKYGFIDGLSDHSSGTLIPIAATALGACIIEKHFRAFHHPETEDSAFSLDDTSFPNMAESVYDTWAAMQPPPEHVAEDVHRALRRSLFAVADIAAGEVFTKETVRSIRPGHGARPSAIDMFLGKSAARDIARGEPMTFEMIAS